MLKEKLFSTLAIIIGIMFVFALSGCPDNQPTSPPPPTWVPANIDPIDGTLSGNTISFTYNGSQGTITRTGGGESLDGVWNGTFDGDTIRVTISGNNWTMAVLDRGSYVDAAKGTVTVSGNSLTIIVTYIMSDGEIGSGSFSPEIPGESGGPPPSDTEVNTVGRLTITDLAAYNGQQIIADNVHIGLFACEYMFSHNNGYGSAHPMITNSQVTLKVYRQDELGNINGSYSSYSGNDKNVTFHVRFGPSNSEGLVKVNFINGIGTGAFYPGTKIDTDGLLYITDLEAHEGKMIRAGTLNNAAPALEAVGMMYDTGRSGNERYQRTFPIITNGSAVLKVYQQNGLAPNHTYSSYNGTHQNVSLSVIIIDSEYNSTTYNNAVTVSFHNGYGCEAFAPQ